MSEIPIYTHGADKRNTFQNMTDNYKQFIDGKEIKNYSVG